jgi:hypothetical protein
MDPCRCITIDDSFQGGGGVIERVTLANKGGGGWWSAETDICWQGKKLSEGPLKGGNQTIASVFEACLLQGFINY